MDDLIAALESVSSALADTWAGPEFERELSVVRALIADLKAGGERAKLVAQLRTEIEQGRDAGQIDEYAFCFFDCLLDDIEAGAHMGGNDADCPPTDAKGDV